MLDALAPPGVGEVDASVAGLEQRRVGKLGTGVGLVLDGRPRLPVRAGVVGDPAQPVVAGGGAIAGEQPAAPRDLFAVVFVLAAFWILMASLIYLYAGRKKPGPPGSGQRPEHTAGPQSSVEAR